MRKLIVSVAVLSVCVGSASATDVYTSEADFVAAIGSEYLFEDFAWCYYGGYTEYTLDLGPEYGYSATVSAAGGANSYLWSGNGNMSTNSALDYLRVDFTGDPVTAVGGWFFPSEINGYYIPGTMEIDLSDGTHYVFDPTSGTDFRGFISDVSLTWMTIEAVDTAEYKWPTMDQFYVGVPEPASLGLMALGAFALLRRR